MIKFHYHRARTDVPRLDIEVGDDLCHVYSDTSLEELAAWGREHGLKEAWIDRSHALPHYDVKVERFGEELGEGVERADLVADIRAWRRRQEATDGDRPPGGDPPTGT